MNKTYMIYKQQNNPAELVGCSSNLSPGSRTSGMTGARLHIHPSTIKSTRDKATMTIVLVIYTYLNLCPGRTVLSKGLKLEELVGVVALTPKKNDIFVCNNFR